MSNSEDQDVRLSLAVLTAKFEAANAAHQNTLEAIKTLLLTEQANLRASTDSRFKAMESEIRGLKTGVEEGKLDRARAAGRAGIISSVISVGVGVAMLALSTFAKWVFG